MKSACSFRSGGASRLRGIRRGGLVTGDLSSELLLARLDSRQERFDFAVMVGKLINTLLAREAASAHKV